MGQPGDDGRAELERLMIDYLWKHSPGSTRGRQRGWRLELVVGSSSLIGEGTTAWDACREIAPALTRLPTPNVHSTGQEWAWHVLAGMLDQDRLVRAVHEAIDPEREDDPDD